MVTCNSNVVFTLAQFAAMKPAKTPATIAKAVRTLVHKQAVITSSKEPS